MKLLKSITLLFIISLSSCIGLIEFGDDVGVLVGKIHFFTDEPDGNYFLFSQGVDFGQIPFIDTIDNQIDSMLIFELPLMDIEGSEQIFELIVKKESENEVIGEANIVLDMTTDDIFIDQWKGDFEIIPNDSLLIIKISE